jgi:hypothetical protein
MRLCYGLLAIALGIVLSSCAAGPALFGPSTGTVSGTVTLRTCGGAYREGQTACHTAPASRVEVTFRLIGTTTTTAASTDSAGRYRIALKPGTYDAVVGNHGGAKRITVVGGKSLTVDLAYTIQLL